MRNTKIYSPHFFKMPILKKTHLLAWHTNLQTSTYSRVPSPHHQLSTSIGAAPSTNLHSVDPTQILRQLPIAAQLHVCLNKARSLAGRHDFSINFIHVLSTA